MMNDAHFKLCAAVTAIDLVLTFAMTTHGQNCAKLILGHQQNASAAAEAVLGGSFGFTQFFQSYWTLNPFT